MKTTIRYYLTLVRMAIIKKSINNKCCKRVPFSQLLPSCPWVFDKEREAVFPSLSSVVGLNIPLKGCPPSLWGLDRIRMRMSILARGITPLTLTILTTWMCAEKFILTEDLGSFLVGGGPCHAACGDPSSLTRDRTHAPCSGSTES